MQANIFYRWTGNWKPQFTDIQKFDHSLHHWREVWLYGIFGLLFALLIVACTAGPSPWIAVALIIGLGIAALAIAQPCFALFLVFAGAGLPLFLLPVPGHTVRPIELALFLCVLAVLARPAGIRLRLPHLLALLFLGVAFISFLHVPEISTDLHAYAADKEIYGWILILTAFFCGTFLAKYVKNPSAGQPLA